MEDWQKFLKDDEVEEAQTLLERAHDLDLERQQVTDKLSRIRNRCIQRRRYNDG